MSFYKVRIALFCVTCTLILAFSSSPPVGGSGAPGDGLCTSCHSNNAGFDGDISISGIPSNPIPNTTYSVTVDVDVSSGSPVRGGFQLVALDNANDAQAGTWSNTDSNSSIKIDGSRRYWGHAPAQNFSGGNISFEADWTAPNISDDVTFYVSAILGNGSGSSGDKLILLTEEVTIMGSMPIVVDLIATDVLCNDGSDGTATVAASGGTPPYDYLWDNGDDTSMIMNLEAGTYTVTVTDDNDSTNEGSITVSEPDNIFIDEEITGITCAGSSDAIVELNPFGGTGIISCDWGFSNDCSQDGLAAGIYAVTLTDENDCSTVEMIEIENVDPIVIDISTLPADMGSNGSVVAVVSGGGGVYDFSWSNMTTEDGVTVSTISDLVPGMYSVTVEDNNGCMQSASASVMGSTCTLEVDSAINNIECGSTNTGAIQLIVTGATGTPTYLWSNGSTNNIIVNVPAGSYSVTVTDDNCAEVLDNLTIVEPDSLMVTTLVRVNSSCATIGNGRITIGINGGFGGYDVIWSHGPINDTIIDGNDVIINLPDTLTELSVGTYTYTITDGNQCSVEDSITIGNGDLLAPFIMLMEASVLLDQNGSAPAIDFSQVDAGSFDNCEIDEIIFDSGPFTCDDIGIKKIPVTIIDGNGNISIDTATVSVSEVIPPELDCSQSSVVANSCEEIFYSVPLTTDNCSVMSLELISGLPSGSVFGPGESFITYRAIDDCNNSTDCTFSVTVNNDLSLSTDIMEASCIGGDGAVDILVLGGTPPYTVFPFENATGLAAGDYSITVTDSGGCSIEERITIGQMDSDLSALITVTDVSCSSAGDGSVEVMPSGGVGNYMITGDTDNLMGGDYSIVITDESGCSITETFTIADPDPIEIELLSELDTCTGQFIGGLDYSITGGDGMYVVDTINTGGGFLILEVTDGNNCTGSLMVDTPEVLPLSIQVSDVIPDDGSQNGGLSVTISGGTEPYMYLWTDADGNQVSTEAELTGLAAGAYNLTLTDACGNMSAITFSVPLVSAINDLDADDKIATIYPSPATNVLNVKFNDDLATSILILDRNGRTLKDITEINKMTIINVQDISSGIYFMQLIYSDKTYVKSFLKL